MKIHRDARLDTLEQLLQLELIREDERDDALDELESIALQRADNARDGIKVHELAAKPSLADTLAWVLGCGLVPAEIFPDRVADLASRHEGDALQQRRQLAASALLQANRRAVDMLYDEDLLDQWQRDAAHDALPTDRLIATPVAALRFIVKHGTLSAQQWTALQLRTRRHGTEFGRVIVEGASRRASLDRPPYARPETWLVALLLVLLLAAFAGRSLFFKRTPPAAPPRVEHSVEQSADSADLDRRAASAVELARQPAAGAGLDLTVTVVQDAAPPAPAKTTAPR